MYVIMGSYSKVFARSSEAGEMYSDVVSVVAQSSVAV